MKKEINKILANSVQFRIARSVIDVLGRLSPLLSSICKHYAIFNGKLIAAFGGYMI